MPSTLEAAVAGLTVVALMPFALGAQSNNDSSTVAAASAASAQLSSQPLTLCIVPGSGTSYRIGEPGLPTQCVSATHTRLTINMTGPQGLQGLAGPKGDTGAVGPAGAKGDTGPVGPAGAKGDSGAQGPAGADGAAGATGLPGKAGEIGPAGADGSDGVPGVPGAPGAPGTPGLQGPPGAAGAPGSTDHSALTNLTADTHPQYLLAGPRTAIDGFSVAGTTTQGALAPTGAGTRLLWNPNKSALRAGTVTGMHWDPAQIGLYSVAFGNNSQASGQGAFAVGQNANASGANSASFGGDARGANSFAVGLGAYAPGVGAIALGSSSHATGDSSIVIGRGTASGAHAFILGGGNIAMETGSISIGRRAFSSRAGAVVISAESVELGGFVQPTAENQFVVRASGGTIIYSNSATSLGVTLAANGGSWSTISDRNKKAEFRDVDGESLLTRLRTVPVTSWKYKAEDQSVRHIGPMAQDWQQAFALSSDSTTINSGDIAGVTLAGVQALDARTNGSPQRIAALEEQVRELQRTVEQLVQVLRASDVTRRR